MKPDAWLDRWLPLISERAGRDPVLELGCGPGADTLTLVGAGLQVQAIDRSAEELATARQRVPHGATFHCQDLREPFPGSAGAFGAVVASLSLHYFSWQQTQELADRILLALRPGGVLLCRLNSTEDHHFGASGHPMIEPGYFNVDGEPKRFFDDAAIHALFADGWRRLSLQHQLTDKYRLPKALWEVVLERTGGSPGPATA